MMCLHIVPSHPTHHCIYLPYLFFQPCATIRRVRSTHQRRYSHQFTHHCRPDRPSIPSLPPVSVVINPPVLVDRVIYFQGKMCAVLGDISSDGTQDVCCDDLTPWHCGALSVGCGDSGLALWLCGAHVAGYYDGGSTSCFCGDRLAIWVGGLGLTALR